MMTYTQVLAVVEQIREIAADYEAAHSKEDSLHQEVLRAIADGECENPAACARAALQSLQIKFSRYCA